MNTRIPTIRSGIPSFDALTPISAADSNSLMLRAESRILTMEVFLSTVASHGVFDSSAVASRNLHPRESLAAGISAAPLFRYSVFAA